MDLFFNNIEAILVVSLFFTYMALWSAKRLSMKKAAGIDPEVFSKSSSPLQRYMNVIVLILTPYAAMIIVLHAAGVQYYSLFTRYTPLESGFFDYAGFSLGAAGLALCRYAQSLMGNSWRVGIDEKNTTELVTQGIYRFIRNPTYAGLFMLSIGVWMIWPSWTMGVFSLVFFLFFEIQVRCEEEHLEKEHGDAYRKYMKATWRYIPYLY